MAVYIQTTTVCNMRCRHCCYNCGPVGEHMSLKTFKAALDAFPLGKINIGGGEPTCNPHFWEILDLAMETERRIWMVTNGKRTEDAIRLSELSKRGKIACGLSQDEWHEPIAEEVVNAFTPSDDAWDNRFIHSVGKKGHPVRAGRCDWGDRLICACCNKPFVKPDGNVHQCGCEFSPVVGTVFEPIGFGKELEQKWPCAFRLPNPNLSSVGLKKKSKKLECVGTEKELVPA